MRNITQKELGNVLELHEKWLLNKEEGECANLKDVNLRGMNLKGANLKGANLCYINLEGADLQHTNLQVANLQGANLHRANLQGANLYRASLREANLKDVNLRSVDLDSANLDGASLEGADLQGSCLRDVYATGVYGIVIGSVSNVGTYNGSVTYVPSLNIVFAGCWQGNEEEFFAKCKEVQLENQFENGRELNLDIAIFMVEKLRKKRGDQK